MGEQKANSQSQSGNANWLYGHNVKDPPDPDGSIEFALTKLSKEVEIRQWVSKGSNGQAQGQIVENSWIAGKNTENHNEGDGEESGPA